MNLACFKDKPSGAQPHPRLAGWQLWPVQWAAPATEYLPGAEDPARRHESCGELGTSIAAASLGQEPRARGELQRGLGPWAGWGLARALRPNDALRALAAGSMPL